MEHRNFPNSSRMLIDPSQDRNHLSADQSYIHMGSAVAPENGSLVYPMDNVSRGGVHSTSQWNSESRGNEYPSSNFSTGIPHLQPSFSVPSYHPFPTSSAAGNIYPAPQYNAAHAYSSYYDRRNVHENESALPDSVTGSGRGAFKRKSPGTSVACERVSSSRFYSAGSSSSSSELPQGKPPSDYHNLPSGPTGLPHYGGGRLPLPGEDPVRNVRSRSRLDLEANPTRTHLPIHSSHHYHSTTNLSSYHRAVDVTNVNANAATQEWNFSALPPPSHGTSRTSGINGLSHERNQFLGSGSGMETGGCLPDSVSSRNLVPPSQYLHAPPIWGAREGRGSHSQRAIPSYRAGLSYPRFGLEAASAENGLPSIPETQPPRYSGPSIGGWHSSHRNGRPRIDIERFQSISSIVEAHGRIGSEDLMMMDRSSFYATSRNLFDQYGDMRLDIDDMGYEELLALEERIGYVSTGLSEEKILKCLTETKKSSDPDHEEGTCCICLEEYASGEEVGTMKKCGHDYHVSCIRKWLLMKNACPICKAPALNDCLE